MLFPLFTSIGATAGSISVALYVDHEQYVQYSKPYKLNWLLLQRAAARNNIQLKTEQLTWVRALKLLEKKQLDAVIGAYYTEKRALFANFSTPFSVDNIYLYAQKPLQISIEEINKQALVVGFTTSSIGENIALEKGIESIYRKSTSLEVFNLLMRGRIDLAIFSESVASTHCGQHSDQLRPGSCIKPIVPEISTGANHTMFSKTKRIEKLAQEIESALATLVVTGEALDIYKSVGYSEVEYTQWLQHRQKWQTQIGPN